MEKTPLVSVTMPVYNGERTIQLAINSLLHQTYQNWKCVIVNDCSVDNTQVILEKYTSDNRFKIIHLPSNKGRGYARQVALENAEGDFLAFLDADDFYHPEKLEMQVKVFNDYPNICLCSTGIGSFDINYKLRTCRGFSKYSYGTNYNSKLYPGFPASCMIKLISAQMYSYDTRLEVGEDNDFIYKCLVGNDYYIVNKILYFYEEIGAVSLRKFVSYQLKYINTLIITDSGLSLFFQLLKEIPKLVVKSIGGLLLGVDFLLMKRGRIPNRSALHDYNLVLSNLRSEYV